MNNQEKHIIISARDMVKRFGHFTANDHLNFDVYKGEILVFWEPMAPAKQPLSEYYVDYPNPLRVK
jgi:ABC-type transporter Mla maintaining outer membrane lipid asymmetry ATPase subunit MlaF